jgi:hypothetical protein
LHLSISRFANEDGRMTSLANYYPATENSAYYFFGSAWLIPVVMLGYFVVIVADNLLVWHSNKTIAARTSARRTTLDEGDQSGDLPRSHVRETSDESSESGYGPGEGLEQRRGDEHV